MLTRRIDAALDALQACRERLPRLRDLYRPGSPERVALDEVVTAIGRADQVMRPSRGAPAAATRID
ncbi:MAG TPA: hypothetical protein VHY34_13130 [Caulobacteraceae bacterium]|jgi:hypothetical protein|nr:hypothetical protein [Caulobacteraceae bacterium]